MKGPVAPDMSFLRHRGIYHPMTWGKGATDFSSAPDCSSNDEFPVGYSSAGCSPAEPASALPTDTHYC